MMLSEKALAFSEVTQELRGKLVANPFENNDSATCSVPSFACELAAWNVTRLSLPDLLTLRKQPGTRFPAHITAPFLKNSDDQTIASLAAIYSGVESLGHEREVYRNWAVVSASRYIGRGSFAATLHKYCKDGPWGVSVQVIPHNMLHSISSTISLALPCVGPCLGAGGGISGETDALLIAINLLASGDIPGVWVTWSTWDPELVVDEAGKPASESNCVATAMALLPITTQVPRARMEVRLRGSQGQIAPAKEGSGISGFEANSACNSLTSILQHVSDLKPKTFDIVCQLRGGLDLDLSWRPQRESSAGSTPRITDSKLLGTEALV
jgi:hypothetical protein